MEWNDEDDGLLNGFPVSEMVSNLHLLGFHDGFSFLIACGYARLDKHCFCGYLGSFGG